MYFKMISNRIHCHV